MQLAEKLLPQSAGHTTAAVDFSGLNMETRNRGREFFRVEGVDDRFFRVEYRSSRFARLKMLAIGSSK